MRRRRDGNLKLYFANSAMIAKHAIRRINTTIPEENADLDVSEVICSIET
ncbi:MAG: hypothetical protein QW175_05970 [Candidatus Bathyarchaeia archaeon]